MNLSLPRLTAREDVHAVVSVRSGLACRCNIIVLFQVEGSRVAGRSMTVPPGSVPFAALFSLLAADHIDLIPRNPRVSFLCVCVCVGRLFHSGVVIVNPPPSCARGPKRSKIEKETKRNSPAYLFEIARPLILLSAATPHAWLTGVMGKQCYPQLSDCTESQPQNPFPSGRRFRRGGSADHTPHPTPGIARILPQHPQDPRLRSAVTRELDSPPYHDHWQGCNFRLTSVTTRATFDGNVPHVDFPPCCRTPSPFVVSLRASPSDCT